MSAFKDHFSGHAEGYARHRPSYPPALFADLASHAPDRALAWDVATGSGQAACLLAAHFANVVATDASAEQIKHATRNERVEYRVEPADHSSLAAGSVSLVCVAQAAHWFDLDAFYAEARRVAKHAAPLALIGYGLGKVEIPEADPSARVNELLRHFYRDEVGAFWPPERRHVENGYEELAFPFPTLDLPPYDMAAEMSLGEFLGYIGTWSAVQRYRAERGRDPVTKLGAEIADYWGDPAHRYRFVMPLILKAGIVV